MTRQTWTALVAAIVFVACAAGLALIPVPFITWTPGSAVDLYAKNAKGHPNLAVTGTPTYPTSGELDLMTVDVTTAGSRLSLPEALTGYWLPDRATLPRDSVYAPGKSADQVESEEAQMMQDAQSEAVVAALRAAHQRVLQRPQITAVLKNGPSKGKLEPGDFVVAVDGKKVTDASQIGPLVQRHKVGEPVSITVERDGTDRTVQIITTQSTNDPDKAAIGVSVQVGYSYQAKVRFGINPQIGGPSAGLMFALGIYDQITPGSLIAGRHIAGTGEIDVDGAVTPIGGAVQKVAAAQRAGATIFLLPAGNCPDLVGLHTTMQIVKVTNLSAAIDDLTELANPATAPEVPRC